MKRTDFYTHAQIDERMKRGYHLEKIDFILKKTGIGKKVLDVGCNDGYLGELLLKNKNIVHGVDIAEKNLKIAKKRGLKVKYFDVEKNYFPFPDKFFDIIILGDIIEHIFETDILFRNCNRILQKNGILIITTPNVASLGRRIMLLLGISPFLEVSAELPVNGLPSAGHIRYYTIGTLKNQLEYNGFSIRELKGSGMENSSLLSRFMGNFFPSFSPLILCVATKNR